MSPKVYLDQVRMSLGAIKERAYEKLSELKEFKRMEPLELAIYFKSGMYWPSRSFSGTRKTSLGSLQHLIDLYVETRSTEFQKEFRGYLEGSVTRYGAADEVDRRTTAKEFLSSVFFDVYLNYSDMLGTRDDFEKSGLKEMVDMEQERVREKLGWKDKKSEKEKAAKGMIWKVQGRGKKKR